MSDKISVDSFGKSVLGHRSSSLKGESISSEDWERLISTIDYSKPTCIDTVDGLTTDQKIIVKDAGYGVDLGKIRGELE